MEMKTKNIRALIGALALVGITSPAFSQMMTDASVAGIRTGWAADSFAVVTAESIVNPAGCPAPDGYISEKSLPGYDTYYAAALNAFTYSFPVTITVDYTACFAGRPVLIGINLRRSPEVIR